MRSICPSVHGLSFSSLTPSQTCACHRHVFFYMALPSHKVPETSLHHVNSLQSFEAPFQYHLLFEAFQSASWVEKKSYLLTAMAFPSRFSLRFFQQGSLSLAPHPLDSFSAILENRQQLSFHSLQWRLSPLLLPRKRRRTEPDRMLG